MLGERLSLADWRAGLQEDAASTQDVVVPVILSADTFSERSLIRVTQASLDLRLKKRKKGKRELLVFISVGVKTSPCGLYN